MKAYCKMYNSLLIKMCHYYHVCHVFISMYVCILTMLGVVFKFSHLKILYYVFQLAMACNNSFQKPNGIKNNYLFMILHVSCSGWVQLVGWA